MKESIMHNVLSIVSTTYVLLEQLIAAAKSGKKEDEKGSWKDSKLTTLEHLLAKLISISRSSHLTARSTILGLSRMT